MGCQVGHASAVAPIDIMADIQNIMDCVLSVRPRILTSTDDTAYPTAVPSMASVPHQPNPVVSGLSAISTPMNPMPMAVHCTLRTRSRSSTIDNSVISSGATKKIVYALASDSWLMP